MSKYLDEQGLSHLWAKIKQQVGAAYTQGNGISINSNRQVSVNPKSNGGIGVGSDGVYVNLKTNGGIILDNGSLNVSDTYINNLAASQAQTKINALDSTASPTSTYVNVTINETDGKVTTTGSSVTVTTTTPTYTAASGSNPATIAADTSGLLTNAAIAVIKQYVDARDQTTQELAKFDVKVVNQLPSVAEGVERTIYLVPTEEDQGVERASLGSYGSAYQVGDTSNYVYGVVAYVPAGYRLIADVEGTVTDFYNSADITFTCDGVDTTDFPSPLTSETDVRSIAGNQYTNLSNTSQFIVIGYHGQSQSVGSGPAYRVFNTNRDIKAEYIKINDNGSWRWEKIGTTSVNISSITNSEIDAICI